MELESVNSGNYHSKDEIFKTLGLMDTNNSDEGSYNKVYTNNDYALRINKTKLYEWKTNVINGNREFVIYRDENQERRYESNIIRRKILNLSEDETLLRNASELGLSPKVYQFGNILITEQDGSKIIYRYSIQDAFDYDLYYFMDPSKLIIILNLYPQIRKYYSLNNSYDLYDKAIKQQLIDLLDITTDTLGIICSDLKPENTMIKILYDGSLVVKLIDWDTSHCKYLNWIGSQTTQQSKLDIDFFDVAKFFNLLIFANHLYKHNNNFLYEEIRKRYNPRLYSSLEVLFTNEENIYSRTMSHYFRRYFNMTKEERNNFINRPYEDSIELQKEHFKILLNNAWNYNDSYINNSFPEIIGRTRSSSKRPRLGGKMKKIRKSKIKKLKRNKSKRNKSKKK
jgi:hypothetical protein